jgi:prepilin-type N-terminal cleavage/methylation domain-containing protein
MKSQPSARRAAFTLIEVLTVVAIIAMLAGIGFAGLRFAQNKSREKETLNFIADISAAIDSYRHDRGGYPRPAVEDEETTIDGETYTIGGAKMLYQVLSGDGTQAIKGGDKVSNGTQGSAQEEKDLTVGKIYMDSVKAPTDQQVKDKKHAKHVETGGEANYYVVDSWRHPFQYQVPEVDKNGVVTNSVKLHGGSTFELWSYGKLKKPDDTEEAKQEWIANWKSR